MRIFASYSTFLLHSGDETFGVIWGEYKRFVRGSYQDKFISSGHIRFEMLQARGGKVAVNTEAAS